MKKITHQCRQGDLLLHPVTSIPANARALPLEQGRVILAHGEVTNHHHSFAGDGATALLEAPTGERYLDVREARPLEHQEHSAITVTAVPRKAIRQREWSSANMTRQVAD